MNRYDNIHCKTHRRTGRAATRLSSALQLALAGVFSLGCSETAGEEPGPAGPGTPTPTGGSGSGPKLECNHAEHELPVVTHWSKAAGAFEYLASDHINEEQPYAPQGPYSKGCYPRFRLAGADFVPAYQHYLGSDYALRSISDADAQRWAEDMCADTGAPIKILRPDAWTQHGVDPKRVANRAQYLQMIHGVVLKQPGAASGSLASVVLPAGWDKDAAPGTYPIIAMSYYDLNFTTFVVEQGRKLVRKVAASTSGGRRGAIGIIYNGNAGKVGYSNNELSYRDFGTLIDRVANTLNGDRHRIVTVGGSRGGSASMNFAANPYDLDYTVAFAVGGAAANHATRLLELVPSLTYPLTLAVTTEVAGFHDAYRPGWTYPTCGRASLRDLPIREVVAKVVFGSNYAEVDSSTPFAKTNVERLVQRGTKVYLSIGRNDKLPPAAQFDFAQRLLQLGATAEVSLVARGGHGGLHDGDARAQQALLDLIDGVEPQVKVGLHHYVADHEAGEFRPLPLAANEIPFNMEVPRVLAAGAFTPWVFSGTPGTEYRARLLPPDGEPVAALQVMGAIPISGEDIFSMQTLSIPPHYPAGTYRYEVSIRKPGGQWQSIPSTNTPAKGGVPAELIVLAQLPNVSGLQLADFVESKIPKHPLIPGGTAWGVSEY